METGIVGYRIDTMPESDMTPASDVNDRKPVNDAKQRWRHPHMVVAVENDLNDETHWNARYHLLCVGSGSNCPDIGEMRGMTHAMH